MSVIWSQDKIKLRVPAEALPAMKMISYLIKYSAVGVGNGAKVDWIYISPKSIRSSGIALPLSSL